MLANTLKTLINNRYLGLGEEILRMSKKAAPVAENLYNGMVRKFLDETIKHLQL